MNRSTLLSLLCLSSLLGQSTLIYGGAAPRLLAPETEQPALMEQLFAAIRADDLATVEEVIALGVDLRVYDDEGNILPYALDHQLITPLYFAACRSSVSIVATLCRAGADIRYGGYRRFPHLKSPISLTMIFELTKSTINYVNNYVKGAPTKYVLCAAPIHGAVIHNKLDTTQFLLGYNNYCLEARTRSNSTPLHLAVQEDNPDMVMLLREYGANEQALGGHNARTPRHLARLLGKKRAEECLRISESYDSSESDESES